ncbi:MAG TPA: hypothetical protein DCE41_37565 [Cytophagales bacterium]|nr:hypothetical protein [Cytophagales bacterium]HAA18908.1 hypothetical protein [Cytophagales bacterium]HAP62559.1 hypothetical protein [Cytophagales bacterium]
MDFQSFTYGDKTFRFNGAGLKAVLEETEISDHGEWTIFEKAYTVPAREIELTFRIIDVTKNGEITDAKFSQSAYQEIISGYVEDVKRTGLAEEIEEITTLDHGWDAYSTVLKLSGGKKSINQCYTKKFDQFMLVLFLGTSRAELSELKSVGETIIYSLSIEP